MLERIVSATVKRLALCQRGKNGLRTLLKSDGSLAIVSLTKADPTIQGRMINVVAAPELPDDDGHFASADVIREMASSFLTSGAELDIEHDGKVLEPSAARVVESFLIQENDPRFADWQDYEGNPVDVTGGWATIIQIDDPELRAAYEAGELNGVSYEGKGRLRPEPHEAGRRVAARLGKSASRNTNDIDMDPEEFQKLLKAGLQAELSPINDRLEKLEKSANDDSSDNEDGDGDGTNAFAEPRPVFEGDANDPAALTEHSNLLKAWDLRRKLAAGEIDADQLAELAKSMTSTEPTAEELRADGLIGEGEPTAEELRLARELRKARQERETPAANNSDASNSDDKEREEFEAGLRKAHARRMGAVTERPDSFQVVKR